MKKVFLTIITSMMILVLSALITANTPSLSDGSATIVQDDFILSFVGVLAGFAIAIITFLFSNIERIRSDILSHQSLEETSKKDLESIIWTLFKEMKQDTIWIVLSLFACLSLIVLRDIQITWINISIRGVTKQQIISCLELSILLSTFLALLDIVLSLFNLAKASMHINSNDK